ncbi:MAG TPA: hypothetical protein ENF21_04230 [Bacteroidetes bacterium]|nr:hypothetical protein [Bacteroidota bacterium]
MSGSSVLKKTFRCFLKVRQLKLNQRVLIFGFFLILSTVFWFLNELNQVAVTELSFPVKYINMPRDRVLVNDLPQELRLQVQAPGYTLLRYKLSKRQVPITLNIESYNFSYLSGTEPPRYYLLSRTIRESLSRQMLREGNILSVAPDTLFFTFDDIVRKKVPVIPVLDIRYARQFQLSGEISCIPDSVTVSGPGAVIDTFRVVRTRPEKLTDVDQTVEETLLLEEVPNVRFSHRRVSVRIPVEQFTESSVQVPIHAEGVPDSITLKVFPSRVNITFMVALSNFSKVQPALFRVAVFFPEEPVEKLKVQLLRYPDYIRSVKFSPEQVEYIIEKN